MIDYFGTGVAFATPITDANGTSITTPSPVQFMIMQDISVDDSSEVKELFGDLQYAVDIGRGKSKQAIKVKQAQVTAALFNSIYYGQTLTSAYDAVYGDRTGTAIPGTAGATSIHITPTSPFGGTSQFVADGGIVDGNGVPYTRVASSPTIGQYVLAATAGGATYSFADQDVGKNVFINYQYSNSTSPAKGKLLTVNNLPMGSVPYFSLQLFQKRNAPDGTLHTRWVKFPACVCTKLGSAYKNDDFTMFDFEISAFADSNNVVRYESYSE